MHCYICDKQLSTEEIVFNRVWDEWEPCAECLAVINEVFEPLSEEEIDAMILDPTDAEMIEHLTEDDL